MSDRLYDRNVALQFGKRTETQKTQVTGLYIIFKTERTSEASPNTGIISVYNMKEDNRRKFEKPEDFEVILLAGYGDNPDEIFRGDVTKAVTERKGPDFVTTIEIGDGDKAIRESTFNKSYAPGTNYRTIMQDAADSLKETAGVAVKSLGAVKDEVAQNGFSFSGMTNTLISNIMEKQGLEHSIQDGELQILAPSETTNEEAVVLTPDTGLIGSPKPREDGIEFVCLIQPRIKPGQLVQIESETVDGNYRVRKVITEGETHGTKWYNTCEAVEVS